MNQDFLNQKPIAPPEGVPAVPKAPGVKRKTVPERDELFRVQKNLYKAIGELNNLNLPDDTATKYVEQAYKTMVKYLKEHVEQKGGL